jgi:hypothetical protein
MSQVQHPEISSPFDRVPSPLQSASSSIRQDLSREKPPAQRGGEEARRLSDAPRRDRSMDGPPTSPPRPKAPSTSQSNQSTPDPTEADLYTSETQREIAWNWPQRPHGASKRTFSQTTENRKIDSNITRKIAPQRKQPQHLTN